LFGMAIWAAAENRSSSVVNARVECSQYAQSQ
jgi:hypothetical protein